MAASMKYFWAGPGGTTTSDGPELELEGVWVRVAATDSVLSARAEALAAVLVKGYRKAVNDAINTLILSGSTTADVEMLMITGDRYFVDAGVPVDELETVLWKAVRPGVLQFLLRCYE